MEKIGYVIGEKEGKVIVDLKRTGSCGDKCASCKSHCEIPSIQVEIDNLLNAKSGDFVEVVLKPQQLIRTSFIIYTIPLIMFILGMTLSILLMKSAGVVNYELFGILIGFVILALTFVFMRIVMERREKERPSILKIQKIL
jgi:sigma-E factor negative regulatory protein RseC